MPQQKVFETHNPEYLSYLFHFTGPKCKPVRIEPWSRERSESRLIALDGVYLGVFHDQALYVWEPINIYLDKDMAKELKKASYAWITKEEDGSHSLALRAKNATKSFTVDCKPNEDFPNIDNPVQAHHDNKAAVGLIRLTADTLDRFRFSKADVLDLYFAGDAAPILVYNGSYESFYGLCMPVEIEEEKKFQEETEEATA